MPGGSSNSDALKLEVFSGRTGNGKATGKKKKKSADYGYR